MELLERLNRIFCEVFDDDDIKISHEMTASDVDGWDSLSHVNLITTIEARFNIRFNQKELLKQRNIGDLLADIGRKTAA
jgi:acyl carrier protein